MLHACVSTVFASVLVAVAAFSASAQAQNPPASQASASKSCMTFGCHAYVYGSPPSYAQSLAGRVDSVFIDAQAVSKDPGVIQRFNQMGPFPMFYVNAYCEKRFGGCPGPLMKSSDVSSQYGEVIQDPNGQSFYDNFNRQLGWVKQAQGKVIEIDNMDEYIDRGRKDAIIKLIALAAQEGINVLAKNVKDPEILKQPNVVGAVVETGAGDAMGYHKAFESVGKACAGVLMINAKNQTGNQYTSFTEGDHPSRGSGSEYTKFLGCKKNPGGMQIAGTPVAGNNIQLPPRAPEIAPQVQYIDSSQDIPPATYEAPAQSPAAQAPAYSSPASSSPVQQTSAPAPAAVAPPQNAPPQFQRFEPEVRQEEKKKEAFVKDDPAVEKKIEKKVKEKDPIPEKKTETKSESVVFYDPLGNARSLDGNREGLVSMPAVKKSDAVKTMIKPFGDARLRCLPNTISRGSKPAIVWSCGKLATRSKGVNFSTRGLKAGSAGVSPRVTSRYGIYCYDGDEVIGSAQCSVRVIIEKSVQESFGVSSQEKIIDEKRRDICIMSFCI